MSGFAGPGGDGDPPDPQGRLGGELGLPTRSVEPSALGFYGLMQTVDHATTAAKTRALLGWEPTHPGLLDDIAAGHYDG